MNAQQERDRFWKDFDHYLQQQEKPFTICHVKGGKNQAAGNINTPYAMDMQTICCEYKYIDQVVLVQVYLNDNVSLYEKLYSNKTLIEKELGFPVEWIEGGKRSKRIRRIQRTFHIESFSSYKNLIQYIFPFILSFIKVFSKYI